MCMESGFVFFHKQNLTLLRKNHFRAGVLLMAR